MIYGNKFFIFKLVFASFLFLTKLEYGQTWLQFDFLELEDSETNCSALNLTNCSFCSPGTIYNKSNRSKLF